MNAIKVVINGYGGEHIVTIDNPLMKKCLDLHLEGEPLEDEEYEQIFMLLVQAYPAHKCFTTAYFYDYPNIMIWE